MAKHVTEMKARLHLSPEQYWLLLRNELLGRAPVGALPRGRRMRQGKEERRIGKNEAFAPFGEGGGHKGQQPPRDTGI